jgi:hypothetical protein
MISVSRKLITFVVVGLLAAALVVGCGADPKTAASPRNSAPSEDAPQAVDRLAAHPRAVDPTAGVSAGEPAGGGALARPLSDAQIRRELTSSRVSAGSQATLTPDGLAVAPLAAPAAVQAVIQAANQIARLPYRYGGGHRTWIDTAYDCSASISFAFGAAGLISAPMVSGDLARWGRPGPGRWITIFANGGHTFMYVAGLRFDTGGLSATGSRWQGTPRATAGFAVRHPPGL